MKNGIVVIFLAITGVCGCSREKSFIKREGTQFMTEGKPYRFIGANYWYGALLGIPSRSDANRKRLESELSFLAEKGVANLRILAGGGGVGVVDGFKKGA